MVLQKEEMEPQPNCEYMASLMNRKSTKKSKESKKPIPCSQTKYPRDRSRCPFVKTTANSADARAKKNVKRSKSQNLPPKPDGDQVNWDYFFKVPKKDKICGNPDYILNDFDPYHVLNFLSNEVKLRLVKHSNTSNDTSLFRLVTSMQNVIDKLKTNPTHKLASECDSSKVINFSTKLSKSTQATVTGNAMQGEQEPEPKTNNKKITTEFEMLEEKYRNLINSWDKLHLEKIELERNLHSKETDVSILKDQINILQRDKEEKYEPAIRKLQLENKRLKSELKNAENMNRKNQTDKLVGQSVIRNSASQENQSKLIEILNKQLTAIEQENRLLADQLNIMKLTEEKNDVMLSAKSMELNELKKNINLIKELTNREKSEFHMCNQIFMPKDLSNNFSKIVTEKPKATAARRASRRKICQTLESASEISLSFKEFNESIDDNDNNDSNNDNSCNNATSFQLHSREE